MASVLDGGTKDATENNAGAPPAVDPPTRQRKAPPPRNTARQAPPGRDGPAPAEQPAPRERAVPAERSAHREQPAPHEEPASRAEPELQEQPESEENPAPRRRSPAQSERSPHERMTMTDQLEPVDDATKYRRKIDNSLARFSAAHDELEAEEQERKQKRQKFAARIEQTRTALQRVVSSGSKSSPADSRGSDRSRSRSGDRSGEKGGDSDSEPEPEREAGLGHDAAPATGDDQRRSRRTLTAGRATAATLAVLVFLATGFGWGAKTWFEGKFNQIVALDQNSDDIRKAAAQLGDENFLIVGSDTRAGAKPEDNVGSAENITGARSDTVMLAHVPKDRRRAVVVSFPRDLEITRPQCRRWNSATGEYGEILEPTGPVKLNSAFNTGGPRCVTKVIQRISGMKINHFIGVNFRGFKAMVDAVGGVTVHLDEPVRDAELGLIVAETGDVVLRGQQALSFVRARKVYSDPTFSGYGRMKRQQQFMSSLLSAALSQDVLFDMNKLSAFINAFAGSTFGENIGIDQMLTLARSMRGLNAGTVTFLTIPTVGTANERGNEVLLEQDTHDLFEAMIENKPLPGAEPKDSGKQGGAARPEKYGGPTDT